jgi:hypothetical protein
MPLDHEGLAHVRKVEIAVKFRGCPDLSGFDASVIGRRFFHKVRLPSIFEVQLQVLQKSGLVAFDSEMIVGLSVGDQILG